MSGGCGCGKATVNPTIPTTQSYPGSDGLYSLYYYQGCTTGHRGELEGRTVFVVGLGTPDERLFRHDELAEAGDYLNSLNPRPVVHPLATASVCDQAIRDLYGL